MKNIYAMLAALAIGLSGCGGGFPVGGDPSVAAPTAGAPAVAPTLPVAATFTVGGTVTGLVSGNSITLTNNGTDNLTVSAGGVPPGYVSQTFTFGTKLANGASYNLNMSLATPTTQPCTSTYGAGAINSLNDTGMLMNVFCGLPGGLNTFTSTGSMVTARNVASATRLPNGQVLVSGGIDSTYTEISSAELYDPATGMWTATGSMVTPSLPTTTLLQNGQVLAAAGNINNATAELYDPATGMWTATGSLAAGRQSQSAVLLPNGQVLVSGGIGGMGALATAELYDPATGVWTATGSMATAGERQTILLPNGKVIVIGGFGGTGSLDTAELYDPVTGVWTPTGSMASAREQYAATLLPNGQVLVSGGESGGGVAAPSELYDPSTGVWSITGSLATGRNGSTATLLSSGKVLVSGGTDTSGSILSSAELYF